MRKLIRSIIATIAVPHIVVLVLCCFIVFGPILIVQCVWAWLYEKKDHEMYPNWRGAIDVIADIPTMIAEIWRDIAAIKD